VEIDLGRINMPSSLINDWLIVEGAGGVLVPINQKQFMLDLMVKIQIAGGRGGAQHAGYSESQRC